MHDFFGHGRALWQRYRGISAVLFSCIALICGLIGSFQYYASLLAEPVPLLSAVIFSTLKLFFFSPTLAPEIAAPPLYEIAKWLAPCCTAVTVFRLIESTLRHNLGGLGLSFRRYTLVCGYHSDSCMLLTDLQRREGLFHRKVVLVTETALTVDERLPLERMGITVFTMPLARGKTAERDACFRRLRLSRMEAVVLFHTDCSTNFSILLGLTHWLLSHKPQQFFNHQHKQVPICAFFCSDDPMWSLALEQQSSQQAENGNAVFDLKRFDVAVLSAKTLFQKNPLDTFNYQCLSKETPLDQRHLEDIRPCHLFIAGFGSCGEQVLLQALNLGVFSPGQQMKVTIFDRDSEKKEHLLRAKYHCLDKICQIEFLSVEVRSDEFPRMLERCAAEITYAAVCFEQPSDGLWTAKQLAQALPEGVPIGVRIDASEELSQFLQQADAISDRVFPFGMRRSLLTRANLVDGSLDEVARAFYADYHVLSGEGAQTEELDASWNQLPQFKKDSVRAQAAYNPYLLRMRAYLLDNASVQRLTAIYQAGCSNPEELLEQLCQCVPLTELAALEHTRWCAFLYRHNYCYGAKKSSTTHPCLLNDWNALRQSEATRATMIYDFIPALLPQKAVGTDECYEHPVGNELLEAVTHITKDNICEND